MSLVSRKVWRVPRSGDSRTVPKHSTNNANDEGSIYSIRRKHISGRDMPMRDRPPTPDEKRLLAVDPSQKSEQHYIRRSRVASSGSRTFKRHLIQNYHAPARDKGLGYRMPRPPNEKVDALEAAVESIKKKPTVIRTSTFSSLQRPVRCERHCRESDAYCEILGPASCSSCIERTNKSMAVELQRRLFPGIDSSSNSLVAPRVAEILCKGDQDLCRKARVQLPSMNNGKVDYLMQRRKSTVTDRFRRIKISLTDVASSAAARRRHSRVSVADEAQSTGALGRRHSRATTTQFAQSGVLGRRHSRVATSEVPSSRSVRKLGPGAKLPGLVHLLAAVIG